MQTTTVLICIFLAIIALGRVIYKVIAKGRKNACKIEPKVINLASGTLLDYDLNVLAYDLIDDVCELGLRDHTADYVPTRLIIRIDYDVKNKTQSHGNKL